MYLGDYKNVEDLREEYKEFCLKLCPSLILSQNEIKTILIGNVWNKKLTPFIFKNLNIYIQYYMPKYITSYLNSQINGRLTIGISDDGEITGIPLDRKLTINDIYKMIHRNIYDLIDLPQTSIDIIIKNNLSINVIKLKKNKHYLNKINLIKQVNEYLIDFNKYQSEMKVYNAVKKIWLKQLRDRRSLKSVINLEEPKKQFIEYLEVLNKMSLAQLLKDTSHFEIPHYEILQKLKKDNTNIYYWLMIFKDIIQKKYAKNKPIKPQFNNYHKLQRLLIKISNLNGNLIENKTINFYLIEIKINGKKYSGNIKFRYPKSKEWLYKRREIYNDIPCCL